MLSTIIYLPSGDECLFFFPPLHIYSYTTNLPPRGEIIDLTLSHFSAIERVPAKPSGTHLISGFAWRRRSWFTAWRDPDCDKRAAGRAAENAKRANCAAFANTRAGWSREKHWAFVCFRLFFHFHTSLLLTLQSAEGNGEPGLDIRYLKVTTVARIRKSASAPEALGWKIIGNAAKKR